MNREIRFRQFRDGRMIPIHTMYSDKSESEKAESGNFNFIEDEILMQFTGLKDKNGVDIYEGDILGSYRIEFFKGMFVAIKLNQETNEDTAFRICWLIDTYRSIITGNIHENPELL